MAVCYTKSSFIEDVTRIDVNVVGISQQKRRRWLAYVRLWSAEAALNDQGVKVKV